jgi:hypothetical protein
MTDRISWDDVARVYPGQTMKDLQEAVAYYDGRVTLDMLVFEVITEGSWVGWSNEGQVWIRHKEPEFWPFKQGEILIISGDSGREIFGAGRKSSKWWVGSETFGTLAQAQELADRVLSGPPQGHGYPSDYDHLFKDQEEK